MGPTSCCQREPILTSARGTSINLNPANTSGGLDGWKLKYMNPTDARITATTATVIQVFFLAINDALKAEASACHRHKVNNYLYTILGKPTRCLAYATVLSRARLLQTQRVCRTVTRVNCLNRIGFGVS